MESFYTLSGNQLTLRILAQPKSAKTGWGSVVERDNSQWIQLKIASPPVDGAANKEAVKCVSKTFKVAKTKIKLVQGEKSRYKVMILEDVSKALVDAFMQAHAPAGA